MDLSYTPEEEAFRARVRAWLTENVPPPGALRTLDEMRDGDVYVVNGQKIWTTYAHISDWFFVLVRTSTEGPKWAGLSLLLMDLKSPGIEIRPIRQIDGGSEFNEVFMTDVRVPVANLLGKEGQGWEVVSSALVNERTGIAGSVRFDQALD